MQVQLTISQVPSFPFTLLIGLDWDEELTKWKDLGTLREHCQHCTWDDRTITVESMSLPVAETRSFTPPQLEEQVPETLGTNNLMAQYASVQIATAEFMESFSPIEGEESERSVAPLPYYTEVIKATENWMTTYAAIEDMNFTPPFTPPFFSAPKYDITWHKVDVTGSFCLTRG